MYDGTYRPDMQAQQPIKKTDPELCRCKANMKGKWFGREYMCVRCGKPVYAAK